MKNIFVLLFTLLSGPLAKSTPRVFAPATTELAQIRCNLYISVQDKAPVLMDGTLTQYDSGYSNNIDGKDARKMANPSENFGMLRGNTVLIIERRHTIETTDSIFFKMWNMRVITYQLEFITSNLNKQGRIGVLEDKFLNTATLIDLNGTTRINFSVTADPASMATDRFRIIFSTLLPLTFTSVNAFQENNSVTIDWKTANENNVQQYDVERSPDINHFVKTTDVKAYNTPVNHYQWEDAHPVEGNNYYRIRSVETDGKISYSDTLKVNMPSRKESMTIYPNPAISDQFNLQFLNQQPGNYEIRLVNLFGQTFLTRSIQYTGGRRIENIRPAVTVPKGIYHVEVKTPAGKKKVITVVF